MPLAGQGTDKTASPSGAGFDDRGYIMVVLLAGMAVAAVWMGALLPSWHQQATREKEAELVFRGEQYARAIELYRRKNSNNLPPNLEALVSQRYLRKRYKDPITGGDFVPVGGISSGVGQTAQVGITGVRSTSTAASIVVYRNQQTYSQFPFDFTTEQLRAGGVAGPAASPDGRGGSSLTPVGGRGLPPTGTRGRGAPDGARGPGQPPTAGRGGSDPTELPPISPGGFEGGMPGGGFLPPPMGGRGGQ